MNEQFAQGGEIELCYETFGNPDDTPILLIMGLSTQMLGWSEDFCERLSSRGYFVIRYDNRDTGRSTKLRQHKVGKLDLVRAFAGRGKPPYGIGNLAEDAFGVLDHLGVERVHLVGVSMGGMIVQTMAIARPERAMSMTSIMSTTGNRRVGWQHPRILPTLLSSAGSTRDSYVERSLRTSAILGSPAFPGDEELARARAYETYDRGWTASGVTRHMLAVLAQPDRTKDLAKLDLPVTVIHGLNDPLVHRSGGKAVANAVPGAEHIEIAGLGHDLPVQLYDTYVDAIVRTAQRSVSH